MLWGVWDVNFRHLRFSALGFMRDSNNTEKYNVKGTYGLNYR